MPAEIFIAPTFPENSYLGLWAPSDGRDCVQPQLNFHHNFREPVRLANTNLFYDPVQVDRQLTKLLLEGMINMRLLEKHQPLGADVALADVEVCEGIKLFGVRIVRATDGSHRAYARGAAFSPAVVKSISSLVLKGDCQREQCS